MGVEQEVIPMWKLIGLWLLGLPADIVFLLWLFGIVKT